MSGQKSAKQAAATTLLDELTHLSEMTKDTAGWYPVYGIRYLLSHPSLYRSLTPLLLRCISISLVITMCMMTFTYLPQVAFCALFSGPLLAFSAAFALVLSESYAIVLFATRAFFLRPALDQIFDAVLVQQGHERLVSRGREVTSRTGIKTLGKSIMKPLNRLSKGGIFRYFFTLPLNALPVVGTILFVWLNGFEAGSGFHTRYFQLKRWSGSDREHFILKHRGAYTAFGAAALALNLIPLAGLAFNFTTTVGAALWASTLEKKIIKTDVASAGASSESLVELSQTMVE